MPHLHCEAIISDDDLIKVLLIGAGFRSGFDDLVATTRCMSLLGKVHGPGMSVPSLRESNHLLGREDRQGKRSGFIKNHM